MKKRLMFLQYIVKESTESLISKVYTALKEDSRKGDFVQLTNSDRKDLGLQYNPGLRLLFGTSTYYMSRKYL